MKLSIHLSLLMTIFLSSWSQATPAFPSVLRKELSLTYQPNCSICHLNGVTGRGTVTTSFGNAMVASGMVAYDEALLSAALKTLTADKIDSDKDGTSDIEELKGSLNPSGPGRLDAPKFLDPSYGCDSAPFASAIAFLVALFLRKKS